MVLFVLVVLLVFIRISGRHRVAHDHEEEEYFDEIQDVKVTKDTRPGANPIRYDLSRVISARGSARPGRMPKTRRSSTRWRTSRSRSSL